MKGEEQEYLLKNLKNLGKETTGRWKKKRGAERKLLLAGLGKEKHGSQGNEGGS